MDPATIATIGSAVSGAGGSILNGAVQLGNTALQNYYNATEAKKQRDWEEKMSNTAYQRAVEDMQKAGINPAMLYQSGGQGASTPTGASAKSVGSHMDILGGVAEFINSITNARKVDAMTKKDEISKTTVKNMYYEAGKIVRTITETL